MGLVYTIGYEGTDIDTFVQTLKCVGVLRLADVRAVPISRKKGFSKTALRARLEAEGIEYVHLIELGDPKPGRDAARAGELAKFRVIYCNHLRRSESRLALDVLAELTESLPTCLMCFERAPDSCHRTIIANHPKMQGSQIIHLCTDDPSRYVRHSKRMPRHRFGQGAPAAE